MGCLPTLIPPPQPSRPPEVRKSFISLVVINEEFRNRPLLFSSVDFPSPPPVKHDHACRHEAEGKILKIAIGDGTVPASVPIDRGDQVRANKS